ncbi:MAG: aspartate carbamoyltransferase, partial [Chloroflexi bacterium]
MSQVTSYLHKDMMTINTDFVGKDIISLDQFSAQDLYRVFDLTQEMKWIATNNVPSQTLAGMVVSLLFFEPSSRTFSSFAAAVKRLGGQTLDVLNPETAASIYKGETFEDTIRVLEAYSDALVLRHPMAGTASIAAEAAEFIPIVNAGDGANEHPTQTLLDLYTVHEHFGRLDNLTGLLAGDPLHSRTLHSLLRGLSLFAGNTVYILSPEQLRLTHDDFRYFRSRGLKIIEISNEKDIPRDCQFWYWTRIQKERFATQQAYNEAVAQTS